MRIRENKLFIRKKEYPRIDNFVVAYVGVVLYFQILLQISPIITFLAATPLYSVQTYLGVLGGGLILLDLFTTKRIWQGKFVCLLLVILVGAVLASGKMLSYGIKQNLFKLCWMAIQFCLVYSCTSRIPKEQLEERLKGLFYALLTIWAFACCVSFFQYVMRYGYEEVVNPLAQDASTNKQGFFGNGLYGIFYTLNHAAYVSVFFAIIAAVCAIRENRIWVRIFLVVAQVILLGYVVLSRSRSALVAALTCVLLAAGFALHKKLKIGRALRVCIVIALVIALCCAGYLGIKTAMVDTKTEDITNGRIQIWSDYISLYKKIGLTGLSPGNYMPYILKTNPDLFIVKAAKWFNPDKYDSGIIYHVHSGYLMVYVSAGLLGALALVAFMVLSAIGLIRRMGKKVNIWFICGILIVVAGAISAAFDEGLFFQNNPQTTMFWLALGCLLRNQLPDTEG